MRRTLFIILLIVQTNYSYAQMPSAAEYNSLIDLYSSTNGDGWTNKTGWATANPSVVQSVGGWHGVGVARVTTYTHSPLVGLTSITDNNNITSFFEYDKLGRLEIIRDFEQNIVKRYKYHYQNEE